MRTHFGVVAFLCSAWGEKHVDPSDSTLLVQTRTTADGTMLDYLETGFRKLREQGSASVWSSMPNHTTIIEHMPKDSAPFDAFIPEMTDETSSQLEALGKRMVDSTDVSLKRALSHATPTTSFDALLRNVSQGVREYNHAGVETLKSLLQFHETSFLSQQKDDHDPTQAGAPYPDTKIGWTPTKWGIQEHYLNPMVAFKVSSPRGLVIRFLVGWRFSMMREEWVQGKQNQLEEIAFLGWNFATGDYLYLGEYLPFHLYPKIHARGVMPIVAFGLYPNRSKAQHTPAITPPSKLLFALSLATDGPMLGRAHSGFAGLTYKWAWDFVKDMHRNTSWSMTRSFPFWVESQIYNALGLTGISCIVACGQWKPASELCTMIEPLVMIPDILGR